METIYLETKQTNKFVSSEEMEDITARVLKAKKMLLSGTGDGNDFLGWLNLPAEVDEQILQPINEDVNRLAPISKVFVVIGIGGSYLGARAVIEALQGDLAAMAPRKFPYVIYAGNTLSEDYYCQLMKILDKQED